MSPPCRARVLLALHPLLLLLLLGTRSGGSTLHQRGSRGVKEEPFCYPYNYTCGPITPAAPYRYVAHMEQTDLLFNITEYNEEFYDYESEVLAVTSSSSVDFIHVIYFFYINKAVIMSTARGVEDGIKPTACTVVDISHNTWENTFPGQNNATDMVLPPSKALLFGDNYRYSWVESNKQRGMECNRWDACILGDMSSFHVEYEWSDPSRVWEGFGYPRERPVSMHVTGRYQPPQGTYQPYPVENIYNFGFFDDDPYPKDYIWAFEIPSGVYCEGLPAGKSPPSALSKVFSMRVEVTVETSESPNQEYMTTVKNWYDFYNKLTRTDSIMNPWHEAGGGAAVAVIRDFRVGVDYVIDKSLGNCTTMELTGGGYDTITTPDGQHTIKNPLLLFGLTGANLTYHGTKYARGLPCDVWVGHFDFEDENSTIHNAYLYEVYMLKAGWTEEAGAAEEHLPVPVLIKVFQDITVGELPEDLIINLQQNIFKFEEKTPLITVFDITPCFTGHDHIRRFQMAFPAKYREYFDDDPESFTFSVHNGLVIYLQITSIRVQHLEIEFVEDYDRLFAEFTLVDQPQVDMDFPPFVGKPLDQVVQRLEDVMDEISFVIFDSDGIPLLMKPYNDSLKEMFEDGCYSRQAPYSPLPSSDDPQPAPRTYPSPPCDSKGDQGDEGVDFSISAEIQTLTRNNDEKIYSPGDMAGMALGMLALGILLGTMIMLATLRKMGLSNDMESIPMNSRRQ